MARGVAIVIALAALMGALLHLTTETRDAATSPDEPSTNGSSRNAARGSLSPDAVLSIAPRAQSAAAPISPNARLSPLMQEFRAAKSYATLYARLSKNEARSAEEQWLLAQILKSCAKFTDADFPRGKRWTLGDPQSRDRFIAALGANDPDRDKRVAAFDAINYDPCGSIASLEVTRKDIRELLAAGSAGGDPKARADLLQHDFFEQLRGPDGKLRFGPDAMPRIDDAQIEIIKQVMGSGDPYAIRAAAGLLAATYANMSLRDADDRPINASAFYLALDLLGCEYGLQCGADTPRMLQACAMSGNCAATNYRDYLLYYQASPSTSQQVAGYEAALRRAAQGSDWSGFILRPGPSPWVAPYMERGGP